MRAIAQWLLRHCPVLATLDKASAHSRPAAFIDGAHLRGFPAAMPFVWQQHAPDRVPHQGAQVNTEPGLHRYQGNFPARARQNGDGVREGTRLDPDWPPGPDPCHAELRRPQQGCSEPDRLASERRCRAAPRVYPWLRSEDFEYCIVMGTTLTGKRNKAVINSANK